LLNLIFSSAKYISFLCFNQPELFFLDLLRYFMILIIIFNFNSATGHFARLKTWINGAV
jgi:hypothetical protein